MNEDKPEEQILVMTREEADKFIRNFKGPVRFSVMPTAFLPIPDSDNKGFDGIAFLSVSRAEFRKVVFNMLSETLQKRGARIRLSLIHI